jgi:rod shape-determining protein MreD
MSIYLKSVLQMLALVLLQALILDEIRIQVPSFPAFTPYLYPLFILLLPFDTPVWLQLVAGFILGLLIDMFLNTAGMHAAATVLIAYLRTNIFHAMLPRNLQEYGSQSPGVRTMSWGPFMTYSAIMIVVHHGLFLILEQWTFHNITGLLLKIVCCSATSLLLIVAYLLLFTRQTALRTN